jgi:hypothetical protein
MPSVPPGKLRVVVVVVVTASVAVLPVTVPVVVVPASGVAGVLAFPVVVLGCAPIVAPASAGVDCVVVPADPVGVFVF